MRLVSWFLMFAVVLALGILVGSTPSRGSHPMAQEAAEVQLDLSAELVFEQAMPADIDYEAAPYTAFKVAVLYARIVNHPMERSEDRTVLFMVPRSCLDTYTGVARTRAPHPLKGPKASIRSQVYTMESDCLYGRPFT